MRLIAALTRLNQLPKFTALVMLVSSSLPATSWAEPSPASPPVIAAPAPVARPAPLASGAINADILAWPSLSAPQKMALQPLQSNWNRLSDQQKRKWLSISANYPRMAIGERTKLHERMAQWATLSPRQRELARLNYAEVQKISPQQKSAKWEAYQALTPTDKQKLAATAQPKPPRTALAAKTEPPNKINRVPVIESDGRVRLPVPIMGSTSQTLLGMPPQKNKSASSPAHATRN